jgi:hypothetical protein
MSLASAVKRPASSSGSEIARATFPGLELVDHRQDSYIEFRRAVRSCGSAGSMKKSALRKYWASNF